MAGIRSDYPGFELAQNIEDHVAEESNLERKENKAASLRRRQGFQKFPMHVHKPEGLHREVLNEDDLADALRKGWKADIRECLTPDQIEDEAGDETAIYNLPIKKALALVKGAAIEEIAKLEADEASHGARAEVLKAIAAAKDAAVPTKAPKAAKTPKKK